MKASYAHEAKHDGVLLMLHRRRLLGSELLPVKDWPQVDGREGAAARYLLACLDSGEGLARDGGILLAHPAVAALPATVAEALGLPSLGTLSITLAFDGIMTDPRARIRASWYDADDRKVRMERIGALARWGTREGRLSGPLYELMEAIDAYNSTEGSEAETRIAAWAPVQAALRRTAGEEVRTDDRFLTSLTVYQAGAVALDVFETPYGPDFLPVVMGREKAASLNDDAPAPEGADGGEAEPVQRDLVSDALLPEPLQRRFAREVFAGEAQSRDAYVLDRNTYLVLDPSLKIALDVVRKKRAAPKAERIAFLKNPRADIAEAIGDKSHEAAMSLLVETWQYSERVLGLGVWEPPPLPWLKNKAGQWLPERFPVQIGQETIEMDRELFQTLKSEVAQACEEGVEYITVEDRSLRVDDVQDAFETLGLDRLGNEPAPAEEDQPEPPGQDTSDDDASAADERLVIRQNLDSEEFAVTYAPRAVAIAPALPVPTLVSTRPKPHQTVGFDWLVACYRAGWPGALLADDMGLGKTFQALAFLAWVRKNRLQQGLDRGAQNRPILVVAPTALLRNWIEEAERHLTPGALGERVDAFGSSLRHLKTRKDEHWTPETALDVTRLRAANWVLTTYETLADNHRAFARVAFSVAVFDEAQKIKSPGAINTQSAKAMNADFVLGLTGTPIENRLADLWCIMDRVVPGYLGDLKAFVATYENGDEENLKRLKSKLDRPQKESTPPVLLRRMKTEILEGLPSRDFVTTCVTMPPEQAQAYAAAVLRAQVGGTTKGDMLRAIHALRGVSLHPSGASDCDPLDKMSVRNWIARSARMQHAVEVLEKLRVSGEKVLVFVEDLEVQALFASAIATHLGLDRQPATINGSIPGEKRLEIVDRFQSSPQPFDLLVLSPKAAGIGLTITAANHVIHLSRWWNPAVEDQCNDRCYRIGQEKSVTVHIPIAVHRDYGESSFDVRLNALLERKRRLSRDMLLPPVEDGDVETLFGQSIARS
ncbi:MULTISPECIES: DEAD/DEAH box helicase [Chelatococcus]|uniref:Superfamily II DNA or RNA helicase n=1 Tax=Chelatococcus caeni TaxID=1348468 RepID=A0A840BVI6_9HYPH|nr:MULTISPECIES: DEAD/DEAH box helicase [unclassified Chelatococcus]MBB4015712.1 superfamily II DNA or RNA helicase [Chelatococcus caeni]